MQDRLKKLYFKFLKACIKNNTKKMIKLEDKIIQLDWEIKEIEKKLYKD